MSSGPGQTIGPLASIGELPPDLLSSFNAAVFHLTVADSVRSLLTSNSRDERAKQEVASIRQSLERADAGLVMSMVDQLRAKWNASQAAILSVTNELNKVRPWPARFGNIVVSNAHLAALALDQRILSEIWNSADPVRWSQCLADEAMRMDSCVIAENYQDVCRHFHSLQFPDRAEMLAEIQLEAGKAAEARSAFKEVAERQEAQRAPGPSPSKGNHSPDFRSVHWFGTDYSFTPTQASCMKVLWQAWQNKTPEVGDATILESADAASDRLYVVFRRHPAWGTMIQKGNTKGTHRLVEPAS